MTRRDYDTIREAGAEAYRSGLTPQDRPFDGAKGAAWKAGYDEAEDQAEQQAEHLRRAHSATLPD